LQDNPIALAVNPVTNKIYVGCDVARADQQTVAVIDGATNAVSTLSASAYPRAIAVNPVTNKIYILNQGNFSVTVIDGATNTGPTIQVQNNPVAVLVNPVTNKIYIGHEGS